MRRPANPPGDEDPFRNAKQTSRWHPSFRQLTFAMAWLFNFIQRRTALILAVCACLLLFFIKFIGFAKFDAYATDFNVYWQTANAPFSMAYELRDHYPFPYMPTMLLWIRPLSLIPMVTAFTLWVAISAVVFTWVNRKYLTAGENALALIASPVVFCLLTGQVSVFLAAVMLWAFGSSHKICCGIALAVVASIKPQLVLMAPLLLLFRKDLQTFIIAAASFGTIIVIALIAFGFQPWADWLNSLPHFRNVLTSDGVIRAAASPAGFAEKTGQEPLPFLMIGILFGVWLVYRCRDLGPVETTAAVGTASIFATPYALTYDLAAISPFLAASVMRGRITSALALASILHPLPIILSAYELLRKANRDRVNCSAAIIPALSSISNDDERLDGRTRAASGGTDGRSALL